MSNIGRFISCSCAVYASHFQLPGAFPCVQIDLSHNDLRVAGGKAFAEAIAVSKSLIQVLAFFARFSAYFLRLCSPQNTHLCECAIP